MRRYLAVAVLFLVLCLAPLSGHVQASSGITISPPLREITLGPGLVETTTDITLQNNTDQTVRASLQAVDLRTLGQYGGSTLDKAGLTDTYDLANWLSLPGGDSVVIAKGQTVKVAVKIQNRSDLTPGGHYGAIVVTTASEKDAAKGNVGLNQQLLSLLFVKKLGGEVYNMQLASTGFKQSGGLPDQVTTTFKNTGNVHVIPRGYIEVTDPRGKLVSKGIINADSLFVLPGSSRQFVSLMQPVGEAKIPGRYKVTVYYRYDGQSDFQSYSSSFTYRTKTLFIMVGFGLALLVGGAALLIVIIKRKRQLTRDAKLRR